MRHPIEIQDKTAVPDGQGGFDEEWSTVETRWANIQPISTAEKADYSKTEVEMTHRIKTRGPRIPTTQRILFKKNILEKERIFHIEGFRDVDEIGFDLEIEVKEIEGDAR
ncbi:phage head closure protein [Natroniella acetigena]|uniref:phage head closure protein n=1 Tax=Natroniella acetigena TaxID=52004 RepID=UPI00200B62CC|nr:phage head closure protein [Natroniella acetigena]MCK8826405.1 phage head closure protein [Natroniella acetigena]